MSTDRVESTKDAATNAATNWHEAVVSNLLHCAYSTAPAVQGMGGPWDQTKVYLPGKSGEDYLAERIVDRSGGPNAYWATMKGVDYFDLILPKESVYAGEDAVFWRPRDGQHGMPEVAKGTPEYNKVIELIHDQIDFDRCTFK
jgi:hypothetical protein